MSDRTHARNAPSERQFKLFAELKRRNIFRVAAAYLATAWLIIHVGYVLGHTFELPKWAMQFVVIILALGFPGALAFAWAFEITPEGFKRTREVPQRESITRITGRKLDFAIIGVLAAALGFVVLDAYVLDGSANRARAPAANRASIAVLPFVDLSPAKDHEYFSDGISEELLNRLSKVDRFKVAGRTSSFAFKGKSEDLRRIGEQLGVESILEGSVRKDGDRLRITAQLVDAHDGSHLWSDTYDRQLTGIFEIQDDIAREVVSALTRTLLREREAKPAETGATLRRTLNAAAYNGYLRGQYFVRKRTAKDLEQAIVEFEHATALDPSFALAHVGLSNAQVLSATLGWRNVADVAPAAERAISRALDLEPDLAEAHAAKYLLLSARAAPRKERLVPIRRAMELNPNDPQTLGWYAAELSSTGAKLSEVVRIFERAYELDPLAPQVVSGLASSLYSAGQHERARALGQELATLTPGGDESLLLSASFASIDGRPDEQLRWLHQAIGVLEDNSTLATMGFIYEGLGDLTLAAKYYERASQIEPSDMFPVWRLAKLRGCNGESARAVALLTQASQRYPDDPYLMLGQMTHQYCTGTTEQLVLTLEATAPGLFRDPPEIDIPYMYAAAPYAVFATRKVGNSARAAAIAASFYTFTDSWAPPAVKGVPDFMRARTAAAAGDRASVIKYLDRVYNSGSALPAWVVGEPLFRPYVSDPAVKSRLVKHAERRKRWREQLAAEGL